MNSNFINPEKLQKLLGNGLLSTREAREILGKFNDSYPNAKEFMKTPGDPDKIAQEIQDDLNLQIFNELGTHE